MTNLFHKKIFSSNKGAATLIITIILLVASTLMIIFAAKNGRMLEKITANQTRSEQAYEAAEAGLEYGINYLKQNSAAIVASPTNGHINNYSNASTTNVSLANGSKFSIVYANPIANNYNIISITSTGTSDDGTATRVITQQVAYGSTFVSIPNALLNSKGSVSMSGNSTITNSSTNNTIVSASTVTLNGNSKTVISSGLSSSSGNIKSDITQNSVTLQNMSQNDFFASYFGTTNTALIKNSAAHYYSNNSDTDYAGTLNGMSGTTIWIDQINGTAKLNSNTTIGTSNNPVLLIVNGSLTITGNVTFYGFIFVIGTTGITNITGNTKIYGGMATSDNLNMTGNMALTYNTTVLNNLRNMNSLGYWAKIPGTWKDF